ncbi:13658_t:CDS:2, partial [Funneliformis mosseae]
NRDTKRRDTRFFDDEFATTQELNQRIKFSRYKLTSKSAVSANKKYPVMRLIFTRVHQDNNDLWNEPFIPGQFIEVQSRIKGQVVVRSYTPIEGKLSKSFSIYVKVYPNGLMSKHLNEQLIGFEIQVRGPFDVSDRIGLGSLQGETMRRSSILVPPSPSSPLKGSLLNPNSFDGCWDELFMICGGTGITPMLQLIRYHLAHIKSNDETGKSHRRIHMHLLFGNRTIEDVIDGIRLEEYSFSSRGMLTISYVLSNPPEGWSGLQGHINPGIIQKWLSTSSVSQFGDIHKCNTLRAHGYDLPKQTTLICDEPPPIPAKPSLSSRDDLLSSPKYQGYSSPCPQTITEEPTSRVNLPQIETTRHKPAPLDSNSLHSPSHRSPTSYHPLYNHEGHEENHEKMRGSTSNAIMNLSNFKIIVCGPPGMITIVEQTLSEMVY